MPKYQVTLSARLDVAITIPIVAARPGIAEAMALKNAIAEIDGELRLMLPVDRWTDGPEPLDYYPESVDWFVESVEREP